MLNDELDVTCSNSSFGILNWIGSLDLKQKPWIQCKKFGSEIISLDPEKKLWIRSNNFGSEIKTLNQE